jgi:hypothetical protein
VRSLRSRSRPDPDSTPPTQERCQAAHSLALLAPSHAVEQWLDLWLSDIKAHDGTRPATLTLYRGLADHYVKPVIGPVRLDRLTPRHVQRLGLTRFDGLIMITLSVKAGQPHHGCYSLGDDQLWGVTHEHKGAAHTLAALKSIRAARPGGYRLFVILDNLSANKTPAIRRWAQRENVELCFTPTNASWANPVEAHFGPLRTFVIGTSDHPNHTVLAHRLQDYLRWRNAHARHPDVLAAQRRERARIRSERQQRWGHPKPKAA